MQSHATLRPRPMGLTWVPVVCQLAAVAEEAHDGSALSQAELAILRQLGDRQLMKP